MLISTSTKLVNSNTTNMDNNTNPAVKLLLGKVYFASNYKWTAVHSFNTVYKSFYILSPFPDLFSENSGDGDDDDVFKSSGNETDAITISGKNLSDR